MEVTVKKQFPFSAESVGVKHERGYREGAFELTEHTQVYGTGWKAPKGAQGAVWCHCEAPLCHL